jgi:hypothetical protein
MGRYDKKRPLTEYEERILSVLSADPMFEHHIAHAIYGKRWETERSKKGAFIRAMTDSLHRLGLRKIVACCHDHNGYRSWFILAAFQGAYGKQNGPAI